MANANLVGCIDSPETCRAVCAALAKHYQATLHYGPDSKLISTVAAALDALKIKDKNTFMKNCAITIGTDIYLPFHVGDEGKGIPSLASQVATVAHECQHVAQAAHDGQGEFWARYFTRPARRGRYEVEAYAVTLEVLWRLTGRMPRVGDLVQGLALYQLRAADRAVCERHLGIIVAALRQGAQIARQVAVIQQAVGR